MTEDPIINDEDPITIKRAFSGIASPKNFVKLGVQGVNISLIVLIILGGVFVWNFFKKPNQTQQQSSNVTFSKDSGVGNVTIVNQQVQDKEKKTVGLEASLSSDDAGIGFVKYLGDHWAGVVGGKWNFDSQEFTPEVKMRFDF